VEVCMNYKTVIVFIILAVVVVCPANASFFDIGEGARPQGMGNSFVAVADDANAMFYNAAGTTQLNKITGTATYTKLYVGLPGLNEGSAAFVLPMSQIGLPGSFGACVTHLNLSDSDAASYRETTIGASYAFKLNDILGDLSGHVFSLGLKAKAYNLKYGSNEWTDLNTEVFGTNSGRTNKWAYGGDASLFYQTPLKGFTIGASLENILQPDLGLVSENKTPMLLRIGLGLRISEQLLTSVEVDYRSVNFTQKIDQVGKVSIGTEYWLSKTSPDSVAISWGDIALRCGFGTGAGKYSNASIGFSYRVQIPYTGIDTQLDYVFVWPFNFVEGLSGTHRASLNLMETATPKVVWGEKENAELEESSPSDGKLKTGTLKKESRSSEEIKKETGRSGENKKEQIMEKGKRTQTEEKGFFDSIIDAIKFW